MYGWRDWSRHNPVSRPIWAETWSRAGESFAREVQLSALCACVRRRAWVCACVWGRRIHYSWSCGFSGITVDKVSERENCDLAQYPMLSFSLFLPWFLPFHHPNLFILLSQCSVQLATQLCGWLKAEKAAALQAIIVNETLIEKLIKMFNKFPFSSRLHHCLNAIVPNPRM